jgi:RNA polymerase sigma-32 factor
MTDIKLEVLPYTLPSSVELPGKSPMLTTEEESLLINQWIETREEQLLVRLIKAFDPLVQKFARKYASYGIARDELTAVGNLALVEVANRFDPGRGLKFSTYAQHWIRGTMLVFIASNYFSFTMKTQTIKKVFFKLRRQIEIEQKKNGLLETTPEVMAAMAVHFGIEQHQIEQIYQMIRQPNASIDDPIRIGDDGEAATFGDTLASDDPSPEDRVISRSMDDYRRKLIKSAMERSLNERERTIIIGQLLQEEDNERTLQDLADEFDVSRERVRQIRNNAWAKLERSIRRKCAHIDKRVFL